MAEVHPPLPQQKGTEQINKGKRYWGKVKRKPGRSFLELLPLYSHRTCSIPPAISGDSAFEMLSTGKLVIDSGFSSGLVT